MSITWPCTVLLNRPTGQVFLPKRFDNLLLYYSDLIPVRSHILHNICTPLSMVLDGSRNLSIGTLSP
jgi:hypothetical protein